MSTLTASSRSTRRTLVAQIRAQLDRESFPRFIVLIMLLVAGCGAFLCSVLALDAGVTSMALRYALATAGGYLVFLLLIRMWIAVRRGWTGDTGLDAGDGLDLSIGSNGRNEAASLDDPAGFDLPLDVDEVWWLAVVALAAGAALIAIGFIVYSAPVLLAEVALDAGLVSTVYRRLRREDAGHWATTALRCTWVSAAVLAAFMAILGFGLQQVAPDASSIGEVVRQLAD